MSKIAVARATAHRDQLRSPIERREIRALLRKSLASLGTVERFRRFHVERPTELDWDELLTPELRELGYLVVGATADVEPA